MNKLKNKVFYTIFLSFSISILILIISFNVEQYLTQKTKITNSLNQLVDKKENNLNFSDIPPEQKDDKPTDITPKDDINNIKYMDLTIYTVLLDDDNNIKDIINHTNNDISEEKVKQTAQNILSSNPQTLKIGFLYTTKYSYKFTSQESLAIVDNTETRQTLLSYLLITILIYIFLELIIFIVAKKITKWITEPVKESFERQKEFIADASHELKTPLSVIIASVEAYEENPQEHKWLNNLKIEADRMNNLIKNLLDLASSERAETLVKQKNNLSKTIELALLTFEGRAFEQHITLKYEIMPQIEWIYDENSLRQLVEILLDNALKHSLPKKEVTLNLSENNNTIELIVTNEGEPIPEGEEEKIFERFYRLDKSRNRKENRYGLGLAIAKNIVINHNGQITAHSENQKTIFKVTFKK